MSPHFCATPKLNLQKKHVESNHRGLSEYWGVGTMGCRNNGQRTSNCWFSEYRGVGTMGCRNNGVSEQWEFFGILGCRNNGIFRNNGVSEQWGVGITGQIRNNGVSEQRGVGILGRPRTDSKVSSTKFDVS